MKLFKRRHIPVPERRRNERVAPSEPRDASSTFRRGRTLTGSASSLVRTASESQADLKSSRVHAHALTKTRRKLAGLFVITAFIVCGLYILVSQFTAQAVVQASPDPSLQLEPVYAAAIEDYLGDHMSERWRFLINDQRLTQHVQAVAPEVQSVRVRGLAGFGKSSFEAVFREPIASWDVSGRQLFVDANGVPFERNYFAAPSLRITDKSGMVAVEAGQSVMSNRFMGYVGQVINLMKQQGYDVKTITIPEGMTRQITITIEGVEYYFKLSSDRPAGEGVADIVKAVQWMKARQLAPEYVDVRVSGRVFYQ